MDKKNLLTLAHEMTQYRTTDASNNNIEAFYRFAKTYLTDMTRRKVESTDEFFEMLAYSRTHSKDVMNRWGIESQNKQGNAAVGLEQWCNYILKFNAKIRSLSIPELTYLFACCSHITKFNSL